MINVIVAYAKDRVIGRANTIPWAGKLPADMRHFKETTMGSALIMGKNTYLSIGRPLPGRLNIVLTSEHKEIEGCTVAHSLSEAYRLAKTYDEIYIIGGERVYQQALNDAQRLYVTEIDARFEGDAFFPKIDADAWCEIERYEHITDEANHFNYTFLTLEKAAKG